MDPALKAAVAKINKKYGSGAVILGSEINEDPPRLTSGSLSFDVILGGGWAVNQWHELVGWESCLDASTQLKFEIRTKDGRLVNRKGGTIKRLWERFHNVPLDPSQPAPPRFTEPVDYFLPSVNEEDRIFLNRVADVVSTGFKDCFEVRTRGGQTLVATAEHRLYTGQGFIEVGSLKPGTVVMVHNNTRSKGRKDYSANSRRKHYYVRQHPTARVKVVRDRQRGYENRYRMVPASHAVIEAEMNGLSLQSYLGLLNSPTPLPTTLQVIPRGMHVHHLDEDFLNDDLSNLAVIGPSEHGRVHALERHNKLRFVAVEDVVESVTPVGVRETYDVRMTSPFNNFEAQRFITHNSGKTTLVLHTIAANQKRDPEWEVWWLAAEPFSPSLARMFGVDMNRVHVHDTNAMEDGYDAILAIAEERLVDCIVIDSISTLIPSREAENDSGQIAVGLGALLTNQFFRKQGSATRRSLIEADRPITGFVVNQWRQMIGSYGDPKTTPQGKGKDFAFWTIVEVIRQDWIKQGEEPIGQQIKVRTKKNKGARPMRVALMDTYFEHHVVDGEILHRAGEFDILQEVVDVGIMYNVIRSAGAWYYYGEEKWNGRAAVRIAVKESAELAEAITKEVLAIVTKTVTKTSPAQPAAEKEPPKKLRKAA